MMLGHVQAIDARFVGGLGEGDPLVEQGRERTIAMLDVVENPDFHEKPGVEKLMNFRLRDLSLAGEKIEIAALVGLPDMGGEHGAVAARVARRRLLPGGAAAVELLLADVEMDAEI